MQPKKIPTTVTSTTKFSIKISYLYGMSISLLDMNPLNNDNNYNNNNHSSPGQENTIQGVNKDDDRVNISISSKAYNILLEHTKQLNRENAETQKPFTIEEVLDEEIILLFGDE